MTLKAISTSDWHLDGGLARFFPLNALEKQLYEIEKVFKYAVENDIRHIFMPGDLTDKARMFEATFIALVTLMMKYDKFLSFYYTLGNHDVAHVGKTSMDVLRVFVENSVFKNVHLFSEPKIQTIDGVDVCFMPYPHTKAPKGKRAKLIFAHVEEVGALGDYGVKLKTSHVKLIRDKRDFVISGHLHTYQHLKEARVLYNGALYQKTFGESLPKGFIEFQAKYGAEGNLLVRHEFVDNRPSFRLETLTIEDSSDWEKLEHGNNVFYRIYLGDGVVAPKNITKDFENIVSLNGAVYRGRGNIDTDTKTSVEDIPKITPLTGLVDLLHTYELDKGEIKRAVKLVKEAINELRE